MSTILRHHIEKIIALTDDEFEFVLSHFEHRHYRKNDVLIREGEKSEYVFFVVKGLLALVHTDASAKKHIVSFAMEDWWEGDFNAFYNQTKATLTLDCLEDTEVYCISLAGYRAMCAGLQKMEYFLLQKSIAGHIGSQQRILSLITSNAKERYDQLLKRYPSLFQRVSKTLIASYLGVSRETLSRLSA